MISALCKNSSWEMVQLKESYEFQPLGGELACFGSLADTLKRDTIYAHNFLHKTSKLSYITLRQLTNEIDGSTKTLKKKKKRYMNRIIPHS